MSPAIDDIEAPALARPPEHPPLATTNPLLVNALREGKVDEAALRKLPRSVREYQEAQNDLIDDLLDIEDAPSNPWDAAPDGEQSARALRDARVVHDQRALVPHQVRGLHLLAELRRPRVGS